MGWLEKSSSRTQHSYYGQVLHKSYPETYVWTVGPQSWWNRGFSQQNGEYFFIYFFDNSSYLCIFFITNGSINLRLSLWPLSIQTYFRNYFDFTKIKFEDYFGATTYCQPNNFSTVSQLLWPDIYHLPVARREVRKVADAGPADRLMILPLLMNILSVWIPVSHIIIIDRK